MDSTLQELSDIVSLRFSSYDPCLYGMRVLGVKSKRVSYKHRRDWTEEEKSKIKELLYQMSLVEIDDHKLKYYKGLAYNRIAILL